MSRIVRHKTFKIGGEEGKTIRLKKWSAGKLFLLVREFWELIEKAISDLDVDKMSEIQLVSKIIEFFLQQEKQAASLLKWSIDEPANLTEENILDWDADDFIGVLSEVVEMNITEELVKNFRKLLSTVAMKFSQKKKPKSDSPKNSTT